MCNQIGSQIKYDYEGKIMNKTITSLIFLPCTIACNSIFPGTQIGTENQLTCSLISSDTLNNLDDIPNGFTRSPREVIDDRIGTYIGGKFDENETPTSDTVSLLVSDPGSVVTVLYYSGGEENIEYYEDPCPPRYLFDLDFSLEADGFPSFIGTLEVSYFADTNGDMMASSYDKSLFTGALPAPVTFDPNDWDVVEPFLYFSTCELCDGWYASLSWEAYNESEVVSGEDYYIENELLFHASLYEE